MNGGIVVDIGREGARPACAGGGGRGHGAGAPAGAAAAEAAGDADGAHEAWRGLSARLAGTEERDAYAGLDGEWTLARRGAADGREAEDGATLAAIPPGPARALAEAELALLRGAPSEVARALEQAAF